MSLPQTLPTRPAHPTRTWHKAALAAILLLAAFLNFYAIGQEGFGNLYYAAAVKSMAGDWHAFFFNSFDPAGFVSVDKPPLGLWFQVVSVWIFGFEGWALMLPQALAGALSVLALYHLVRRVFGPTAGIVAALALAVTPISVAANRNNTMDSSLALFSLLAAWGISLAAEKGKLRWLLLCAVLVGIGFNIKMLQAYLVLPAFFLLYLFAAPLPAWKRIGHLALAVVVLLVISLSWAVAVDLTPAEARPYVGSSQDNTVMELIIGHNGMSRLLPRGLRSLLGLGDQAPGPYPPGNPPGGGDQPYLPPPYQPGYILPYPPASQPGGSLPDPAYDRPAGNQPQLPAGMQPNLQQPVPPVSGDGMFTQETGERGLLRLFNRQLAGQITWLLPLAFLGGLAILWQPTGGRRFDLRRQAAFLWLAWLLPQMAFFSYANLFHRYYLCMMAPGVAALVGAGLVAMAEDFRARGWKGWLLPLSLAATAILQAVFLSYFPTWGIWMAPLILCLAGAAVLFMLLQRLTPGVPHSLALAAATLGLFALLVAPCAWSLTPILYGGDTGLPYAGPELAESARQGANERREQRADRLTQFLVDNHQGETYLLATMRAGDAAPFILSTGQAVMAMGGFSGSDPILTAEELSEMIRQGEARFFLLTGGNAQGELAAFIRQQCSQAPPAGLGLPVPPAGQEAQNAPQIFDCGNLEP